MKIKNKLQKIFRFNQLKHLLSKIKQAGNNKILNTNRKNILNNFIFYIPKLFNFFPFILL